MNKSFKYCLYTVLLLCYGFTYHVVPLVHYHQIRYGSHHRLYEKPSSAKELLDYDGSVCLICSRVNTSQAVTFDFEPFQTELHTVPFFFEEKPLAVLTTDYALASPRAPPLA